MNTVLQPRQPPATGPDSVPAGSPGALAAIRGLVADDLAAVDECIRQRLKSRVPMVDEIAEHIIASGGKRLRPLLVLLAARATERDHRSTSAGITDTW